LPPGGLIMPAVWPEEASAKRTLAPSGCAMRQAASQGTMYLMGENPPACDLLYWNSAGARVARAAHPY
jgi:hypothetical protein